MDLIGNSDPEPPKDLSLKQELTCTFVVSCGVDNTLKNHFLSSLLGELVSMKGIAVTLENSANNSNSNQKIVNRFQSLKLVTGDLKNSMLWTYKIPWDTPPVPGAP